MADGRYRVGRITLTLGTAFVATLVTVTVVRAEPRPTIAQVQHRVGELYEAAEQATERYNEARMALAGAERRLAQAQNRVAGQQAELARKQKTLGVMAAATYRAGGIDPQLNLLFSDDPSQFLERASALDMLSRRQAASVRQAAGARQELQADRLLAAQQLAAVEQWRETVATQRASVESTLRAAQEQLRSLREEERKRLAALAAERQRLAERAAERYRLAQRAARQQAARTRQQPATSARRRSASPAPAPVSGRAGTAVAFARAQLGEPYVYGAAGPDAWDCSGLTMMAWRAAGVSLPHSSSQQYSAGTHVSRSQLQAGDLVFFYSPIHHVGIYIGGGNIIHAPNPSERVKISPVSEMPYAGATRP